MDIPRGSAIGPEFFADYADPDRREEHIHRLGAVTGLAAADPTTIERYEAIASGDKREAGWYWDAMRGQVMLENTIKNDETEIRLMTQLVERLSVDANTHILTYNTQQVLFERMIETGLFKEMQTHGYALEMLLLDIDKLKQHNAIGEHTGGNEAMGEIVRRLKSIYRRSTDFIATPGLLGHQAAARNAVKHSSGFRQLSRFERGDEVIGFNFMRPPKNKSDERRNRMASIDKRTEQIASALRDVWVTYEYKSPLSPGELRETFGPEEERIKFTVDDKGTVRACVSGTFALVRAPLPATLDGLQDIFKRADSAMDGIKTTRSSIQTRGVPVSLFTVE